METRKKGAREEATQTVLRSASKQIRHATWDETNRGFDGDVLVLVVVCVEHRILCNGQMGSNGQQRNVWHLDRCKERWVLRVFKTSAIGTNERTLPRQHGRPFVWQSNKHQLNGWGCTHIVLRTAFVQEETTLRAMLRASYRQKLDSHGAWVHN